MIETQPTTITLDEVRARFLETESRLQEAVDAIDGVRSGAASIGATREALTNASERLAGLSQSLSDLATGLGNNAEELRKGVDAIRASDPAETRRQVEELGETFTASQAVAAERLDSLESKLAESLEHATAELHASAGRSRLEARIGFLIVAIVAAAAVVLPLATATT